MSDFTNILYYNNSDNFIASSNAEVTTVARLKSLVPTDALSWSTYTTTINLSYSAGTAAGTATGGASVAGGKLDLTGGTTQYVTYDAADNANSQQVCAVRLKYTPAYSGSPASKRTMFAISETAGSTNNLVQVVHTDLGKIQVNIYDQAGGIIIADTSNSWSPTTGQTYEIELNVDITNGATRIFIDGILLGSVLTGTGTRSSAIAMLRIGSNHDGSHGADFSVEDFIYFQTVQHTANYTAGYTLDESEFTTTPQSIIDISGIEADGADAIAEGTPATPANTSIKHVVSLDNVDYWYATASSLWTTSSGAVESNPVSVTNSNLSTLDMLPGVVVRRKIWLESADGISTPTIVSNSIDYDYYQGSDTQSFCLLNGYLKDNGAAVEGGTVSFKTYTPYGEGNNTTAINATATSRSNGYYEKNIVQGASIEAIQTWVDLSGKNQTKKGSFTVPATTTASLEGLI